MIQRLRSIPLFGDLSEHELEAVASRTVERRLGAGEQLFAEGDEGHDAFVIVSGELEILKRAGERDVTIAVRGEGDVVGEMALLQEAPRIATARARSATVLLAVPKAALDDLLASSAGAARALFGVILERWKETEARMRQQEQLAQLGTLAAGLAHELDNPAAAATRSATRFVDAARRLASTHVELGRRSGDLDAMVAAVERIATAPGRRLAALERRDRESDLAERLAGLGVEQPQEVAPSLVDVEAPILDALLDALEEDPDEGRGWALTAAAAARDAAELGRSTADATGRISDIVAAVRSYTFLGQAPVQEIDLNGCLDDTLTLLRHRLGDIDVVRDYGEVPPFAAHGTELNQVWTNLLVNAADAVDEREDAGRIVIRTRIEGDSAVVEIEDDGPGIPPHVLPRIFDSFFTTKPPGKGTGLGLDISFGIVVGRHGGEISVDSEPGRTVFRVALPLHPPG